CDRLERSRRRGRIVAGRPAAAIGGADVLERQIQCERAAYARRAREPQLAAEQMRELAADRQTQARAAVLARGARIRLLERFEDDLLFLRRDSDAGIGDAELHDRRRLAE